MGGDGGESEADRERMNVDERSVAEVVVMNRNERRQRGDECGCGGDGGETGDDRDESVYSL